MDPLQVPVVQAVPAEAPGQPAALPEAELQHQPETTTVMCTVVARPDLAQAVPQVPAGAPVPAVALQTRPSQLETNTAIFILLVMEATAAQLLPSIQNQEQSVISTLLVKRKLQAQFQAALA